VIFGRTSALLLAMVELLALLGYFFLLNSIYVELMR
jgi:hypothetical protein